MPDLLESVILCNQMPKDYICVSKKFVRHPKGFAVGALVKNMKDGKYYIFTGSRIANIPQDYAKQFVQKVDYPFIVWKE